MSLLKYKEVQVGICYLSPVFQAVLKAEKNTNLSQKSKDLPGLHIGEMRGRCSGQVEVLLH